MAKSYIAKHNVKPSNVEAVANAAHRYVQHWTRNEAQRMLQTTVCIIPARWGLQVGKFAVKQVNTMWHVHNYFDELVDAFTCKQSAVTFCILEQANKINLAQELRQRDMRISKLTRDQAAYQHRKSSALKTGDMFGVDLANARLNETVSLVEVAKKDLEKTLNKAKYLKGLWEPIL